MLSGVEDYCTYLGSRRVGGSCCRGSERLIAAQVRIATSAPGVGSQGPESPCVPRGVTHDFWSGCLLPHRDSCAKQPGLFVDTVEGMVWYCSSALGLSGLISGLDSQGNLPTHLHSANGTSSVFVGFNSRLESLNCTDVVHGVWQQESGSQAKDAGE